MLFRPASTSWFCTRNISAVLISVKQAHLHCYTHNISAVLISGLLQISDILYILLFGKTCYPSSGVSLIFFCYSDKKAYLHCYTHNISAFWTTGLLQVSPLRYSLLFGQTSSPWYLYLQLFGCCNMRPSSGVSLTFFCYSDKTFYLDCYTHNISALLTSNFFQVCTLLYSLHSDKQSHLDCYTHNMSVFLTSGLLQVSPLYSLLFGRRSSTWLLYSQHFGCYNLRPSSDVSLIIILLFGHECSSWLCYSQLFDCCNLLLSGLIILCTHRINKLILVVILTMFRIL